MCSIIIIIILMASFPLNLVQPVTLSFFLHFFWNRPLGTTVTGFYEPDALTVTKPSVQALTET